jgi:amidase
LSNPVTGNEPEQRSGEELAFCDACTLATRLRAREISAVELMQSCLGQIEHWNPVLNALPTLRATDALLAEARAADAELERGAPRGPLHGLPYAVKDLFLTAGLRTTFGSLIYRDYIPDRDELIVARMKKAGAIVVGKSNTPEFGAGSQTFNRVFGVTRNPYDPSRTSGGSSGGAAAALATGMVALADGSDLGGSLRNPASFCNVVGLRPSPGRVPRLARLAWDTLSVHGPMARTVGDAALMLSVIAGPDARDPIALDEPGSRFAAPLETDFSGVPIAWSRNLGRYPVDTAVTEVFDAARGAFEALGFVVEDVEPPLEEADEIFQTLRAAAFASEHAAELETHRVFLKDTIIWNIEQGLTLSARDVGAQHQRRAALYRRMLGFLDRYRFLIAPVAQVPPFPLEQEWVSEIAGIAMHSYIDWMGSCYAISVSGLPAISVPGGFTTDGLPVGVQIVGRPRADWDVLRAARAFEQATRHGRRRAPPP